MEVSPSAKTPVKSWTMGTVQESVCSIRYQAVIKYDEGNELGLSFLSDLG